MLYKYFNKAPVYRMTSGFITDIYTLCIDVYIYYMFVHANLRDIDIYSYTFFFLYIWNEMYVNELIMKNCYSRLFIDLLL